MEEFIGIKSGLESSTEPSPESFKVVSQPIQETYIAMKNMNFREYGPINFPMLLGLGHISVVCSLFLVIP